MKRFAQLFQELDETQRTSVKIEALVSYFGSVPDEDAAWAVSLLCGRRPRRIVRVAQLRLWCAQISEMPDWLFDECYEFVGDLSETISLLLPPSAGAEEARLHVWMEQRLPALQRAEDAEARRLVTDWWSGLDVLPRFVFNKLLTGGFRVGVSQGLVVRALSSLSGVDVAVIAHRLMGTWQPSAGFFRQLIDQNVDDTSVSRPYPFCLAQPLGDLSQLKVVDPVSELEPARESEPALSEEHGTASVPADWIIDWKWDGIRAQMIRRKGQSFLWSRGEELLNTGFPELLHVVDGLPDGTVLDGEIVAWQGDRPAPFAQLQRRIGRRTVGAKLLREVPVRFIAFDLLENQGCDIRQRPLRLRRDELLNCVDAVLQTSMHDTTPSSGNAAARPRYRVRTLFDDLPAEPFLHKEPKDPKTELVKQSSALRGGTADADLQAADWLAGLQTDQRLVASPALQLASWDDYQRARDLSRQLGVEGLMLKSADSVYGAGRATGLWWKWKVDPFSCDAVLVYAQRGHGRRSGLYTDYTFAAWEGEQLVPFAKAYSGLSKDEILQVDRFIQKNTLEKFGPVIRVRPELVFELAFEGLQRSGRHKSGIAVRFPRIVRPRPDKTAAEADTLESIRGLATMGQMNSP